MSVDRPSNQRFSLTVSFDENTVDGREIMRRVADMPGVTVECMRPAVETSAPRTCTQKDAARYEWLRENWMGLATHTTPTQDGPRFVDHIAVSPLLKDVPFDPQSLDHAIDAAIAQEDAEAVACSHDFAKHAKLSACPDCGDAVSPEKTSELSPGDPCPRCKYARIGISGKNLCCSNCGWLGPDYTNRGEVMNPPESVAQGSEARNLNTPQRHGLGASPQGEEAQATQPPAAPSIGLTTSTAASQRLAEAERLLRELMLSDDGADDPFLNDVRLFLKPSPRSPATNEEKQ